MPKEEILNSLYLLAGFNTQTKINQEEFITDTRNFFNYPRSESALSFTRKYKFEAIFSGNEVKLKVAIPNVIVGLIETDRNIEDKKRWADKS